MSVVGPMIRLRSIQHDRPPAFCAVLLSLLAVVGLLAALIAALSLRANLIAELWTIPGGLLVATYLLLLIAVGFCDRTVRRGHLRDRPDRTRRLAAISQHPDGIRRLPHRVLEHHLRRAVFISECHMRRVINQAPPGTIIMLDGPDIQELVALRGESLDFEPLGLSPPDDRLLELFPWNAKKPPKEAYQTSVGGLLKKRIPDALRLLKTCGLILLWALGFIYIAWLVRKLILWPGVTLRELVYTPNFWFPVAFVAALLRLFWERQWWLVPGGLLRRDYRLWRRGLQAQYFRAKESVFLVDCRSLGSTITIYIPLKRRCGWVVLPRWYLPGILWGLLSRARPPTEDEVQSFLDGGQNS